MARGRPRKVREESLDNENRVTATRDPRIPLTAGGKLTIPEHMLEKGYHYCWPTDKPGNLERMQRAWYEFVTDDQGRKITVPAGKGETHYLMRIEQKYRDEEIGIEQSRINDNLKKAAELQKGEYVPDGHDGVLTREVIV